MNEKRVLKIDDVKVFIIPNKLGAINNNLVESYRIREEKLFNEIFALNGIDKTIDVEKDQLVQLWFHSESLDTDNLVRHGGRYTTVGENGVEYIRVCPKIESLPACLFAGVNEGESINLKVPDDEYVLDMTVTVDQAHSRYANFGNFEDVLEDVTGIHPQPRIVNNVLKFRTDGFIVPNHADRICDNDYWQNKCQSFIDYLNKVCQMNGYSGLNINRDHIVDVWLSSKDQLKSENLSDHGATIIGEDCQDQHIQLYSIHWIPDKILYGHCEGDEITIKVPFNPTDFHHPELGDVVIEMKVRLAQTEYRYKRFGHFEDVLDRVCK